MFLKSADCEYTGSITQKQASSLFEEIMSNNSLAIARTSVLPEDHPMKQNFNTLRRIAEKKDALLAFATRAISAHESHGPNRNADAFEREQLKKFYKTFMLKPHLLDHKMEIPYVRGIIADARWNEPKDYVETLIFVDKENFPKYAESVEKGVVNGFSMGVQVDEAECSVCGNIARNADQFCSHIPRLKGLVVGGTKCFEFNRGLTFIEQSAVVSPADPDSHTLYILANVKGTQHPEIERLKKVAEILNSYTEQDKQIYASEYLVIESFADQLANRIAKDMGIPL